MLPRCPQAQPTPPQSCEATESTSDGEYTHLDPPAAGWAKRERAESGGKTERTEQEWVHLSMISNSTTEERPQAGTAPGTSSWHLCRAQDAEDGRQRGRRGGLPRVKQLLPLTGVGWGFANARAGVRRRHTGYALAA